MPQVDDIRAATGHMTAEALLRHLLIEAFPGRCVVTSSLRARSVVVLGMVAAIDAAAPVVFCHAPGLYPESVEYRARIVAQLGLSDLRDPGTGETAPLSEDRDHWEETRSTVPGGASVRTLVHLNRALEGFDCWISAVYHRPYGADDGPRIVREGRLVRIDPLSGWTRDAVDGWLAAHGLPHHPHVAPPEPAPRAGEPLPSYHY